MSDAESPASPDGLIAHVRKDGGAQLRAAREAHGLSIETVAQHLKLAPRQVRALEDGDASRLPGRTFVRGFARNYARLMQLDPESIVAALPDAEPSVVPDQVATGALTRPIGELPASHPRERSAWPRMALLLVMAALAAVAAYYELGIGDRLGTSDRATPKRTSAERPVDPIGPPPGDAVPLPNPVVRDAPQAAGSAPAATADPTTHSGPLASPTTTLPITAANTPVATTAQGTATLVIKYAGPAWTEVRDANGQRLLLVTGTPGTSETVSGMPPFELTLGNAAKVAIDWRGASFDLAPHTKGNVARVRLP